MDRNTFGNISKTIYSNLAGHMPRVQIGTAIPAQHIQEQALQQKGKNEQAVTVAAKKEEDKQIMNELVKKSNRCIIKISSVFPWTMFPNTINVEESRVTFIFRQFLASQSHSVDIKDISNVLIQTSPFFATIQVVSRTFVENNITIGHLDAKKARRVHMVIEGLRTFEENNIDTSNFEVDELITKIEEFQTNAVSIEKGVKNI